MLVQGQQSILYHAINHAGERALIDERCLLLLLACRLLLLACRLLLLLDVAVLLAANAAVSAISLLFVFTT